MSHERRNKRTLPWLELFTSSVDRTLRQHRSRQFLGTRLVEANLHPLGDSLNLLDNGLRKGIRLFPQGVELLFHPPDPFRGSVLPEDLVVLGERAPRLVNRSKEARLGTIRSFDNPSLPMKEDVVLRNDLDLNPPARQQLM